MMISELKEIELEDIAIICNYINDEAKANGVVTDPYVVSSNIEFLIRDRYNGAYKIEDNGVIIAFIIYERQYHENTLAHFYVEPRYRTYRSVMVPLVSKLVEVFKDKRLYYKKLHSNVDAVTHYANDGEIDVVGLEEFVNRMKR
jgi:hypothetical protein